MELDKMKTSGPANIKNRSVKFLRIEPPKFDRKIPQNKQFEVAFQENTWTGFEKPDFFLLLIERLEMRYGDEQVQQL